MNDVNEGCVTRIESHTDVCSLEVRVGWIETYRSCNKENVKPKLSFLSLACKLVKVIRECYKRGLDEQEMVYLAKHEML